MVDVFFFRILGGQVSRTIGRQAREIAIRIENGEATKEEIQALIEAWENRIARYARKGDIFQAETLEKLVSDLRQHLNS